MCFCKILPVGVHVGVTVGLTDGRTVKQKKKFSITIRQQHCNVISLRVIIVPVGFPVGETVGVLVGETVGVLLGVADGETEGHERIVESS